MKPAALAATVLLHAAVIGPMVASQSSSGHLAAEARTLQIALIAGTASATETPSDVQPAVAVERQRSPSAVSAPTEQIASAPGQGVVAAGVSIPADYAASNRKPAYPLVSRKLEEQGTVLLHILVKADGRAGEVRLSRSSGHPLLDESAIAAARDWRFRPAEVNRQPVAEWYQVAIPFNLQD